MITQSTRKMTAKEQLIYDAGYEAGKSVYKENANNTHWFTGDNLIIENWKLELADMFHTLANARPSGKTGKIYGYGEITDYVQGLMNEQYKMGKSDGEFELSKSLTKDIDCDCHCHHGSPCKVNTVHCVHCL